MTLYLVIGLLIGFVTGSTVRSFEPFVSRYRMAQAERDSAQRAITILAGQYRV